MSKKNAPSKPKSPKPTKTSAPNTTVPPTAAHVQEQAASLTPVPLVPFTPTRPTKKKRLGALDAAYVVLSAFPSPMRCIDILAQIQANKLWTSHGKTPEATLCAAILREIKNKGEASRFVKADRGRFAAVIHAPKPQTNKD